VQILGSKKSGKENLTNKAKPNNEGKDTQKQKEIIGGNNTANRDRKNLSLAQVSQENELEDERSRDKEDLNQAKAEQEGTSTRAKKKETQGPCKPKATNTLQVIISDPKL